MIKIATQINITVADDVYKEIVLEAKPEGVGRSEWLEMLIRKGYAAQKEGDKSDISDI